MEAVLEAGRSLTLSPDPVLGRVRGKHHQCMRGWQGVSVPSGGGPGEKNTQRTGRGCERFC